MEENDDSVGSTIFQWCVILFLSFILVSSVLIEVKVIHFPPEETSTVDTLSL